MEQKCAVTLAHFLAIHIPEVKGKENIIRYGFELMITVLIGMLLMILVSFIGGQPLAWLPFILGFAPIRTTAGGFHASSHLGCYIITTAVFFLVMVLAVICQPYTWIYTLVACMSFALVFALSPVEAKNKPLSHHKRVANRRVSLLLAGAELIGSSILFVLDFSTLWTALFYYGILAASVSLVAAKITTLFRKENVQ